MILVFAAAFRMVVDLDFVALVTGIQGSVGAVGIRMNTPELSVLIPHFVHNPDYAIAHFPASPIEQAHAAMRTNHAVLYPHTALATCFQPFRSLPLNNCFHSPDGGALQRIAPATKSTPRNRSHIRRLH